MMDSRKKNLLKRIVMVRRIVQKHYEPGNHARCMRQVWKKHVNDIYPMSERTFYRYMNMDISELEDEDSSREAEESEGSTEE